MVNKPMRCALKATNLAAARLSAAAQDTVGDNSEPTTSVVGPRESDSREGDEAMLQVVYSGESDPPSDSESHETKPAKPMGSGKMNKELFIEMFGSPGSPDEPMTEGGSDHEEKAGGAATLHQSRSDHKDHDAKPVGIDTNPSQEERTRNVLRLAPQLEPWLPPADKLARWAGKTGERSVNPLFDASRIHRLDANARGYHDEQKVFIDAFFKHRWYSGKRNKDLISLFQAWDAFIQNVMNVGRDQWFDRLRSTRDRFELRFPSGARYKLHRLSREAGLPCLSWGDPCPCCPKGAARAPKEAYSLDQPYWRARISLEMRDGIANLQSLYERTKRSFSDGPGGQSDEPRHTDTRGSRYQPAVGSEAPSCHKMEGNLSIEQDSLIGSPSDHGGSASVPQGSASRRASPPRGGAEAEKPGPIHLSDHQADLDDYPRMIRDLQSDVDHAASSRRDMREKHQRLETDLANARADCVRLELALERASRAMSDEIVSLRNQLQQLIREHKSLVEALERGNYLRPHKKQRTDSTGGGDQRKT